jgi:hypothetical protein
MRILPVTTNQQNTNKTKNPNFGKAFVAETPEILKATEELIGGKAYSLTDVLTKTLGKLGFESHNTQPIRHSCIGDYVYLQQKTNYLNPHPNTYLEKSDIESLIDALLSDVPGTVKSRLDSLLAEVSRLSIEALNEELPYVRTARTHADNTVTRARKKVGL